VAQQLFAREAHLVIGTTDVTGLDFEFQVRRTLKPEPNVATIKVYNLSAATRKSLEASVPGNKDAAPIPVKLEAGYVGAVSQIYYGDVRDCQTIIEGPEVITTLNTGDKETALRTQRCQVPLGPGTTPAAALQAIATALGVGFGTLANAQAGLSSKGLATLGRLRLSGYASTLLTDFCNSAQLEWSVQNGVLQILDRGKALEGTAVYLSSNTGLIESPARDSKGIVSATTLMIPDIRPGTRVQFDAKYLGGFFRIVEVETMGDTLGKEWYHRIKCDVPK
jgi:hypothetical protein